MKFWLGIALLMAGFDAMAAERVPTANEVCLSEAKNWIITAEADYSTVERSQVRVTDLEIRGAGALLWLMSAFVDSPNTGENTHWEVVGEFNYGTSTCEIKLARRYWAH